MSTGPLFPIDLDPSRPLGLQIEERVRSLIRSEALTVGSMLPSTRGLAADLGISRGVVVNAYAQLAAEAYITLRRGAPPLVAAAGHAAEAVNLGPDVPIAGRLNLRPDLPDLALFPRAEWLRSCRRAVETAASYDLSYGDPFGSDRLRIQLSQFLGRTRGTVSPFDKVGVFAGSTQALLQLCCLLRERGKERIAVEDPSHRWRARVVAASELEVVPVPVDEHGLLVEELPDVDAVVVSPEHQFPTGAVLSPERRRRLVEWAAAGDRLVIEHDYDGMFRYDRHPTGSLQGLAPELVAYVGSASPLLAPSIRIGWAVVPARLVDPLWWRMFVTSMGTSRLLQFALADLIERGALDRHLRKMRVAYRRRRDVLARRLPVTGAPAGLFVALRVDDEAAALEELRAEGYAVDGVNEHTLTDHPPGLVLGFAASAEPTLERAAKRLQKL
jgi:GntR family transcriptional regulator/MocR family aminotransferase